MPLYSVKEEPPGDLDPYFVEHVEMTFECFEAEPLSDVKEEHITGVQADSRSEGHLKFCSRSVDIKQEFVKDHPDIKLKHPNTFIDFDIKVESWNPEVNRNYCGQGNEIINCNTSSIKNNLTAKDTNSDFSSENQNIDHVTELSADEDKSTPAGLRITESCAKPLNFDSKSKVLDCRLCGKLFHSLETLRKHRKIHIKEKPYKCDVCSKMFAQHSYLKRHKTIHVTENKKLTCDYCLKKFSDNIRLRQHQNQVHFSEDRKYRCDICLKTFKLEGALKCHIQTHSGKKSYTCETCNNSFSTHTTLIHHQKIHAQAKPFKCSFCGREFLRLYHLKNHSAVHNGVKAFQCTICGKPFGHSSNLKQHQLVHTGERFGCNICEKTYSRPAHVRLHVARAHTKVKSYSCEVCSDKFYTTGELILHLRAHIGEKPFSCEVCKKTFVTSFRRDQHSYVHTNNKRYQCEVCGQRYYTLKRLKGHVDRHRKRS